MRIAIIGGNGTIGRAVAEALAARHEVVRVGRTHGDVHADITDPASVRKLFAQLGQLDAVVSAAGSAAWKPLPELSDADFEFSLHDKLMGQVNLVRYGRDHVRDGGSFTLTSGILARSPMQGSAAVSLVNAGVEAFARAAALELPRLRVNAVSPPWVSETLAAMGQDPSTGMPAKDVARAYVTSVEGRDTGAIIQP
ncbi:MAG: short chain dehydrogenase [Acidobacteria bacterium]|nr:short chain dehydrogenase [Acidobacteriota bacterium]